MYKVKNYLVIMHSGAYSEYTVYTVSSREHIQYRSNRELLSYTVYTEAHSVKSDHIVYSIVYTLGITVDYSVYMIIYSIEYSIYSQDHDHEQRGLCGKCGLSWENHEKTVLRGSVNLGI